MRDPKRIGKLITELRQAWHAHPDLRLGQLIALAASRINEASPSYAKEPLDPFYIEDYLWEAGFRSLKLK